MCVRKRYIQFTLKYLNIFSAYYFHIKCTMCDMEPESNGIHFGGFLSLEYGYGNMIMAFMVIWTGVL